MKRTIATLGLILLVAGCATQTVSPPAETTRPGFVKKTLDNGLVILCQENRAAPIAVVQAFVRTGSMFEQEYLGHGISHFCEHLVSGGTTANRSEKDTEKLLDELGGANNAFTSTDRTSYFIRTTSGKNFETACAVVADWMQNASITQAEFDREYKVIQREIEKGKTEPGRALWKLAAKTANQFHPARHPVIGYIDLFRRITRDDVVKYYKRKYAPDNMIVVAVGDFDAQKTADRIAGLFKDAKPSARIARLPQDDPPQQGMRTATVEMDVKSAYVIMSFRTVPLSHPDLYPLDVMSYVLSNGASSRLVQRLREKEQLVDSISSWSHTPWYGAGALGVRMVLKPENIKAAKAAVLDELNRMKTELVTAAEMRRALKKKVADEVFHNQTVEQQVRSLGGNYLSTGNPFFDDVYLRKIKQATPAQIRSAAQRYISADNLTVSMVVPMGKGAVASATTATPTGATATSAKASPVEKIILPNGLRVLIKRNPNVPLVTMQAFFLGGLIAEDKTTVGSSNLLGRMLTRGTTTRSALEIARTFDDLAGSIGGGSGSHTFYLQADVLAEDFEKGFGLFADCLLNPAFSQDELAKIKTRTLNALARQNDDWYRQAHNLLRKTVYPTTPYGLNRLGSPESLKGITREKLAAYHRNACVAKNGVLAIYGDVDVAAVKTLVARLMAAMPSGKSLLDATSKSEKPLSGDQKATATSRRPNSATVYAAWRTCSMGNLKDRYPLLVLDGVMSGVGWPGGWLHDELRGKGLVYVVHAYNFLGLRRTGYFGAYALTRPDKVDEVVSILDKNAERARTKLVPKDEFERAKKMAVTVELLGRQTNRSLAMSAALDELYGRGYDFSKSFPQRVKAVTREDVLRVAKQYLKNRVLVIVRPQK
jgi:zinc protease